MAAEDSTISVEQLGKAKYRARSTLFPNCEAVAPSAEAAREAVEHIIERIIQERIAEAPLIAKGDLGP